MGRKRKVAKAVTTLVPHRTPHLSELFGAVLRNGSTSAVRTYLAAGGSASAATFNNVPLLFTLVLGSKHPHTELDACIKLLLNAGADINALMDSDGVASTALTASLINRPCCVKRTKILIDNGADPLQPADMSNSTTSLPLHHAARLGLVQHCKLLLLTAANNITTSTDDHAAAVNTALYIASDCGQVVVMKLLLQHGAQVNMPVTDGWHPLHIAAHSGQVAAMELLIQSGAVVNAADDDDEVGSTPLMLAAAQGSIPAATVLLNSGADTAIRDCEGDSVLAYAVLHDQLHLLKFLVEAVRSGLLNVAAEKSSRSGKTLLMIAAQQGHREISEWLITQGAGVNEVMNSSNSTALTFAAANGHIEIVELLLANNASVDAVDADNMTALFTAMHGGHLACVEALIAAGADVNHRGLRGMTCLHYATLGGHAKIAELLLEHGAILNATTSIFCGSSCCGGMTALMFCDDAATLKVLLAAGADVHALTDTGNSCLHAAAAHSKPVSVICLLIKEGVDVHALNLEGKTAAQIAHDKGFTLIETLLNRVAR